jgi:hypothetical protein
MSKVCRYGCGIELGKFDEKQNKYLETDGTVHTRERCGSLKEKKQVPNGHNDISVEVLLKKLDSIGIKLDLARLRNV